MFKKKDVVEIAYFTGRLEIIRRFNVLDYSRIPIYFDIGRFKPSHTFRSYKSKALKMSVYRRGKPYP